MNENLSFKDFVSIFSTSIDFTCAILSYTYKYMFSLLPTSIPVSSLSYTTEASFSPKLSNLLLST